MKTKIITKKEAVSIVLQEIAERNERDRLLVSTGRIRGYFVEFGLRLENQNAEQSADAIIRALSKDSRHYEYETGHIHLFV